MNPKRRLIISGRLALNLLLMHPVFATPPIRSQSAGTTSKLQIRLSGIEPVWPAGFSCPGIASPCASTTRNNGSQCPASCFGGQHGGIDLTLNEGTPLLALASGSVIVVGEGGVAEGIVIWLQHRG